MFWKIFAVFGIIETAVVIAILSAKVDVLGAGNVLLLRIRIWQLVRDALFKKGQVDTSQYIQQKGATLSITDFFKIKVWWLFP